MCDPKFSVRNVNEMEIDIEFSAVILNRFIIGQCATALGMESGEIPDEDISASSMYDPSLGPKHAR
jgi:hypothetical protein